MTTNDGWNATQLSARTLRVLAHPLRLRMLGLLRTDGAATASGLAQRVGESSGTTSWHLRQLAEVGLVEQDTELGNKRERWWRAVHDAQQLATTDFLNDPEQAADLRVYLHSVVEQRYAMESQFVAEYDSWPQEWIESVNLSDFRLSLTADETAALNNEIQDVLQRYTRDAREGDSPVHIHWGAFPRTPRPESGEQS